MDVLVQDLVFFEIEGYKFCQIHPFWFLGDMILSGGLALIGPYIKTEKNQSKSLAIDFWFLGD